MKVSSIGGEFIQIDHVFFLYRSYSYCACCYRLCINDNKEEKKLLKIVGFVETEYHIISNINRQIMYQTAMLLGKNLFR